jgi:hypothetical protein
MLHATNILFFCPSSATSQAKRSFVFQSEEQSESHIEPLNTTYAKRQKKGTIPIYNFASFKNLSTYKSYSYSTPDKRFEDANQHNKEPDNIDGLI